jgi:hypothetical protein
MMKNQTRSQINGGCKWQLERDRPKLRFGRLEMRDRLKTPKERERRQLVRGRRVKVVGHNGKVVGHRQLELEQRRLVMRSILVLR